MTNTDFFGSIRALCAEYNMLPKDGHILCALSGGADSMALLYVLMELRKEIGFTLSAAHYNHQLRGEESFRDAIFVQEQCKKAGIPLFLGEGQVRKEAKTLGRGIEETARNLRYAFLEDCVKKEKADRIATAHHADDTVETVLLHLLRGTGLRGLTGIPPVRKNIVRPLLTVSREDIESFLQREGIPFVEDSSNEDRSFARNRLRHDVIPILREMNPNLAHSVAGTVRALQADQAYIEARALELYREASPAEDGMVIPTQYLGRVPKALVVRVIQRMLEEIEAPQVSQVHFNRMIEIAQGENPSAALHLPGGVLVQRVYGDILIAWDFENTPLPAMKERLLCPDENTSVEGTGWVVSCRRMPCPSETVSTAFLFYIGQDKVSGDLRLRAREPGDVLALPGRRSKTLKKLMIEKKVPRRIREHFPVLADDLGVIAVAGLGPDRSRLGRAGEPSYEIKWEKIG